MATGCQLGNSLSVTLGPQADGISSRGLHARCRRQDVPARDGTRPDRSFLYRNLWQQSAQLPMHDHNVLQMFMRLLTNMHVQNPLENEAGMAARPQRRKVIPVLVSVPASGSVGGGLATIGHGGDL